MTSVSKSNLEAFWTEIPTRSLHMLWIKISSTESDTETIVPSTFHAGACSSLWGTKLHGQALKLSPDSFEGTSKHLHLCVFRDPHSYSSSWMVSVHFFFLFRPCIKMHPEKPSHKCPALGMCVPNLALKYLTKCALSNLDLVNISNFPTKYASKQALNTIFNWQKAAVGNK